MKPHTQSFRVLRGVDGTDNATLRSEVFLNGTQGVSP